MITLVVDTETTGLPMKGIPASDPKQARVLQFGAVLLQDSKEVACLYTKLFPDNWPEIHPAALNAHGITLADCQATGIGQKQALAVLDEFVEAADIVVAHNYKFDYQMLTIEYELQGRLFAPKKHACTMELMTPICKLTKSNGQEKWPNLAEAATHVGYVSTAKAHDALADVKACVSIWKWLVANGKV